MPVAGQYASTTTIAGPGVCKTIGYHSLAGKVAGTVCAGKGMGLGLGVGLWAPIAIGFIVIGGGYLLWKKTSNDSTYLKELDPEGA